MSQNFLNKYVRHAEVGDLWRIEPSFWADTVWLISLKTGYKYGHKPEDIHKWIDEGRYTFISDTEKYLYV